MNAEESKKEQMVLSWNTMADFYDRTLAENSLQASVMLFAAVRARDAKSICEVGVGPGLSSMIFISAYMQNGAQYYNSDFSEKMIEIFAKKYAQSEFANSSEVKYENLPQSSNIEVSTPEEGTVKKVYSTVADNEALPYSDDAFDCYLANLSLMLVNDPNKMLSEAYRVTQKGGTLGFTVIGNPEKQVMWTVIFDAFKEIGVKTDEKNKPPTHLGDKEVLKEKLEVAGLTVKKLFYTTSNFFMNVEEAFAFSIMTHLFKNLYEALSEEKATKLKEIFTRIWHERFGDDSLTPTSAEFLVAIAEK